MSKPTDLIHRRNQLAERLGKLSAAGQPHQEKKFGAVTAFLLIDTSASMVGDKLEQGKRGALDFSRTAFSKGYSVGLISFASDARLVTKPAFTDVELSQGLNTLKAGGSTNMADALRIVVGQLSFSYLGVTAVLVTDGFPDDEGAAIEAAHRLKSLGVEIIAIGTEDANENFLSRIASRRELALPVKERYLASGISSAAKLLSDGR